MKRSLLLTLLLLIIIDFAGAQTSELPIDPETKKITFSEIVKVDSTTKDQLFVRAKEWTAKTFKSAKDVIQVEDKNSGLLVLKGLSVITIFANPENFPLLTISNDPIAINSYLHYLVKLEFKNARYRYEITDLTIQQEPGKYSLNAPIFSIEETLYSVFDESKWDDSYEMAYKGMGILKPSKKKLDAWKEGAIKSSHDSKKQYTEQTLNTINSITLSLKKALENRSKDDW